MGHTCVLLESHLQQTNEEEDSSAGKRETKGLQLARDTKLFFLFECLEFCIFSCDQNAAFNC